MSDFLKSKGQLRRELLESGAFVANRRQRAQDVPYLFLSLDLVKSTRLKLSERWIQRFSHFFEAATDYARGCGYRIWKYRGDEALFFKELDKSDDLLKELQKAHQVASRLNTDFSNERVSGEPPSAKATMWIALAQPLPHGTHESVQQEIAEIERHRGSVLISMISQDVADPVFEFLGLSIDAGFRISEASHPQAVAVSVQLAHAVLNQKAATGDIRVVGYRVLKGVAEEPYPVLWYAPSWQGFRTSLKAENWSVYEAAALDLAHRLDSLSCNDYVERLKLTTEVERIRQVINQHEKRNEGRIEGLPLAAKQAEVHCVAVCFNERREVLLGQRKQNDGNPLSEKWEFGCAQLRQGLSFEQAIQQDYLHDFGIHIVAVCSDPVTTFLVPGKELSGIIFVAKVIDSAGTRNNKHQRHQWLPPESVAFNEAECVPDFMRTLARAKKIYDEWQPHD